MEQNYEWIYTIEISVSSLSFFGSFLNLLGFIYFKSIRSFALEMVFYLSLCWMMNNISFIIHKNDVYKNENDIICKIQGFGLYGLK